MKNLVVLIFIFLIQQTSISADVWPPASIKVFKSDNGRFFLKVFPTIIPENYYRWHMATAKRKSRFKEKDTTIVLCHAIFSKIEGNDTVEIWNKRLINSYSPVYVIIADDGRSIVTFDNWGNIGYGLDVMVIYNESGGLVRRYRLEDFSPFPINEYPMSISSIYWRCWAKYLDNKSVEICFQPEKGEKKIRRYNLDILEFTD